MERHTHSCQHDLMKWPSNLGQPQLEVEGEIVFKLLFVFFYLNTAGPPTPSLKIKVEKNIVKLWLDPLHDKHATQSETLGLAFSEA